MGLASDLEQVLIDNLSDTGEESIELDSFVQKKLSSWLKGYLLQSLIGFKHKHLK